MSCASGHSLALITSIVSGPASTLYSQGKLKSMWIRLYKQAKNRLYTPARQRHFKDVLNILLHCFLGLTHTLKAKRRARREDASSVDRFSSDWFKSHRFFRILPLLINSSPAVFVFHEKGAGGNVAAVSAPDTGILVDVNESFREVRTIKKKTIEAEMRGVRVITRARWHFRPKTWNIIASRSGGT